METQQETTTPSISLQDLAAVVGVIDLCSKRGSFEGPELEFVGALRGRIASFVKANAPQQPPEEVTEKAPE